MKEKKFKKTFQNFVAKQHGQNKGGAHRDKTKFYRKEKHKNIKTEE